MTQTIGVYSETGGATKTTTAVGLASETARAGLRTLLIDLDPRGAATKWVGAEPVEAGLHIGAILGNDDPTGWANDLAVPTSWHPLLWMIPSSREVSLREKESADNADIRLRQALTDVEADVVVLDCPNRQGGPLILNALTAADSLVIAAKADEDGLDGVDGAIATLHRYHRASAARGLDPATLVQLRGIVVGAWADHITPRNALYALDVLRENYAEKVLVPLVPRRVIVAESRSAGVYFGEFEKGRPVADAYAEIAAQVIDNYPTKEAQ